MKCLLVIDMQEDYVRNKRNKKRYPYDEKKRKRQRNNAYKINIGFC
ncbi:hypothetical protein [Clostridium sp.]|nr:hypothetical protein [Clostridium sp.]MDU4849460.1 hypothetical protein [Clostridium sp.]